jgi:4-hydroxyacetophenone monooxygenase
MHYIISLLGQMFARGIDRVDVRRDVYDDYNAKIDSAHAQLVWAYPGVATYYKNSKGRAVVNNPFRILDVWSMTETADLGDFHCTRKTGSEAVDLRRSADAKA